MSQAGQSVELPSLASSIFVSRLRFVRFLLLAFVLLGSGIAVAGDLVSALEAKISRLQTALQDYPDLRPMILRQLTEARRELRQRLQQDLDLLSKLTPATPEEQKTLQVQLDRVKKRIAELDQQLKEQQTPEPTPAEAKTTEPAPAMQKLEPAKHVETPAQPERKEAPAPAPAPAQGTPVFNFSQNPLLPGSVKLWVDISRQWSETNVQKGCSNKPNSQDAGVWKVVITARPVLPDPIEGEDYYSDANNNLYIPVVSLARNTVALAVGSRTYVGSTRKTLRNVRLEFEKLTLAEVGDLVGHITDNAGAIQETYSTTVAKYEVFQVTQWTADGVPISEDALYGALTCYVDALSDAFGQQLQAARQGIELETCDANPKKVKLKTKEPFDLSAPIKGAKVDRATVNEAKRMLKVLVDAKADAWSTDPGVRSTLRAAEDQKKSGGQAPPVLVVDEPCFQFSIAPILSADQIKPAASFRFRYDYYSSDSSFVFKVRAEGQGAEGGNYFDRAKFSGEGTTLLVQRRAGWQLAGGFVGDYSFTRKNAVTQDEWKAGAKLEAKAPFLRILDTLPGSNAKPTFSFEAAAAGGDGSSSKSTDVDLSSKFLYTLRPSPRLSLDIKGARAWSNKMRFAQRRYYGYFNLQGRFNLTGDWDYLVQYECGRKDPDYRKFCGWLTGFVLVTGR